MFLSSRQIEWYPFLTKKVNFKIWPRAKFGVTGQVRSKWVILGIIRFGATRQTLWYHFQSPTTTGSKVIDRKVISSYGYNELGRKLTWPEARNYQALSGDVLTRAGPGCIWTLLSGLSQIQVVRLPGHVKTPHLRKSLNARHSYTEWLFTLKLSEIDIHNSIYKIYISEFLYRWPKVRSNLRPLHYKSTGENWKPPLLDENHSRHFQTPVYR